MGDRDKLIEQSFIGPRTGRLNDPSIKKKERGGKKGYVPSSGAWYTKTMEGRGWYPARTGG
jgi:hypothetical protein